MLWRGWFVLWRYVVVKLNINYLLLHLKAAVHSLVETKIMSGHVFRENISLTR